MTTNLEPSEENYTELQQFHDLCDLAIKVTRHERWLRNIAVALGNAPGTADTLAALQSRVDHPSDVVREHVQWALHRHNVRT